MGWVRELWVEVMFVAVLVSAAGALLQASPRLEPEAVALTVLFLSHLVVLGAATFLIVHSTLAGWWLAGLAFLAVAGPRLVADGVERVLLGASPAEVIRRLAVDGTLTAAGVVLVVVLARGWQRGRLCLKRAELVSMVPAGATLTVVYACASALAVWALAVAGLAFRGAAAPGAPLLLAAGLARGAVMVAFAAPLLFTLLGRRVKNALAVGALLGLGTVAAHLATARSLSWEMLAGAVVQGVLSFLLGVALVRWTRPPVMERQSSSEQAEVVHEESRPAQSEPP